MQALDVTWILLRKEGHAMAGPSKHIGNILNFSDDAWYHKIPCPLASVIIMK